MEIFKAVLQIDAEHYPETLGTSEFEYDVDAHTFPYHET